MVIDVLFSVSAYTIAVRINIIHSDRVLWVLVEMPLYNDTQSSQLVNIITVIERYYTSFFLMVIVHD